jgi:hypothetical protein
MELFEISEVNPNDAAGGGGCACSDTQSSDTKGPFAVFYASESASNQSPHVVVCAGCIRSAGDRLDGESGLACGERGEVTTTTDPTGGSDEVPEV